MFAELSDGWMFPCWVVGASHIRAVEAQWPSAGSLLHHRAGWWPLSVADSTSVLECDPPRRLVVQARVWPFGAATVTMSTRPERDECRVNMLESPTRGPARWLDNPLQRYLLRRRNREALARLATIAENRPDPRKLLPL